MAAESLVDITVEEQVATGTEEILQSSFVSEGPGRIANSPVPSIFHDDRGEIHRLRVRGMRVNMLSSNKDVMRSGYLVRTQVNVFVLIGKVEVWTLTDEGTDKTVYQAHQFCSIPPYVPYILNYLEDTIMMEYWEGKFQCWYYHPYRRLVQLTNELVANKDKNFNSSIGQFHRLVPAEMTSGKNGPGGILMLAAGLCIGFIAGVMLERRHKP